MPQSHGMYTYVRRRFLSYSYVAAFNLWLMICPSALSHDWQMNSLPLVTSLNDVRNIGTCVVAAFLLCATCKILSDMDVSTTPATFVYTFVSSRRRYPLFSQPLHENKSAPRTRNGPRLPGPLKITIPRDPSKISLVSLFVFRFC